VLQAKCKVVSLNLAHPVVKRLKLQLMTDRSGNNVWPYASVMRDESKSRSTRIRYVLYQWRVVTPNLVIMSRTNRQ